DSIVRGNTTRQIIGMLRDAGATEVHLRISAPPIRFPCHYGVDMSTPQEMIAHGRSVEEVAAELGADSLAYLSLDGLYEAIGQTRATHCDACFTGDYPLERTESSGSQLPAVSMSSGEAIVKPLIGSAPAPGRSRAAHRRPRSCASSLERALRSPLSGRNGSARRAPFGVCSAGSWERPGAP